MTASFFADPADLFVQLVSELQADFDSHEAYSWMDDPTVSDIADLLERAALREGRIEPDSVEELFEAIDEDDYPKRLFSILLGLDRALLHANPFLGSFDQGALTSTAIRYAQTGRFNTNLDDGALLPKAAIPGRRQHTPNTLNDAFAAVVWVPPAEWHLVDHRRLRRVNDLTRVERQGEFDVACAPMLAATTDLRWERVTKGGKPFYRIGVADPAEISARQVELLASLDASGAVIAVLPELAIRAEVLDTWLELVREIPPVGESRLKWLVAGSGNTIDSDPPVNRCVLIDRVTGEVVLEQDKQYPFTLTREQLEEWNLGELLGTDDIEEDIRPLMPICVYESAIGRIVVLICEDLARLADLAPRLRSHGISHVLAPVFSKETKPHHWEHVKAKEYAAEAGALVIIANSLVIPRLMDDGTGPWGTAAIHSPAATQFRSAYQWNDIAFFRVGFGDPVPLAAGEATVERHDDDFEAA
jgi:predicted amidohydrolase